MNIFLLRDYFYKKLFYYLFKWFFKKIGKNVNIIKPLKINGFKNIVLGNNVTVQYRTWLAALPLTGTQCLLEIGEGTNIGHFNHIYATQHIKIGKNVLTADKVYISDNLHSYQDIHTPIIQQPIKQINPVEIGDGTWIGENAVILGAKVGKNCVIGSNAVVTQDIPDYSIAVGIPAKVIKQFDTSSNTWIKVTPKS